MTAPLLYVPIAEACARLGISPDPDVLTSTGMARYLDSLARVTASAEPRLQRLGTYTPPAPVYDDRTEPGCLHQFAVSFLLTLVIAAVIIAGCWAFT